MAESVCVCVYEHVWVCVLVCENDRVGKREILRKILHALTESAGSC